MKMSENCTQMSLFPEMEESISSPVASPARTFRLQEIRKELRQREVDSFSKLPGSPTRSSPIAELDPSLCWRTSQTSLLETGEVGQEPYMGSWPSEGIVLNGKLWEQPMWGHLTGGSDGGQSVTWPTPDTQNHRDGSKIRDAAKQGRTPGTRWGMSLHHAVVQWPTPRANSAMASTITPEVAWDLNRFPNLETEVGRRTWPTPLVDDANNVNPKANRFPTLVSQVKEQEGSGSLNCNWVEALMGYPQNWTSLDDGETDPGRKESPE